MTIVVTTPTGRVGSRVAELLIQAGERPRLLARDAERVDPALRRFSEIVEVDLGEAEDVAAACAGADTLYWVDPPTTDDDPIAGYDRMGASAAHAVKNSSVSRVVFQSSVGAEARGGFGEIDGLGATEERLNATGADVTHLRCGYFFSNLLMDLDSLRAGHLFTTLPLEKAIPLVDPRDIGEVAAALLLSRHWSGRRTQGVHGPKDLSFTDVANTLTQTLGQQITAVLVSDDDVAQQLGGLGMTAAQVDGIVGMMRGTREDFIAEDPRDIRTTTPTTLAAWSFSTLRPAFLG